MRYWLMKTEPDVFSIDDVLKSQNRVLPWEGDKNSNKFHADEMKKGDLVLMSHSNAKPPGIAGIGVVSKEAFPDHLPGIKKVSTTIQSRRKKPSMDDGRN